MKTSSDQKPSNSFDSKNHKTDPTWGCEFLDDSHFGRTREICRLEGIHIPIQLMFEIADQRLLDQARLDPGFKELRASIQAIGLQKPGTCYSDGRNLRFQDGYHRLVSCSDLGHLTFPVVLLHSESRIRASSMPLEKLAFRYLQERDENGST